MTVEVERLCRDVFPAELAMPDGQIHQGVRAFVTTHRVIAYAEADRKIIPEPVVDVALLEPGSVPASRNSLFGALECRTASGTVWVNRGRGCGCHSSLGALASPISWTGE